MAAQDQQQGIPDMQKGGPGGGTVVEGTGQTIPAPPPGTQTYGPPAPGGSAYAQLPEMPGMGGVMPPPTFEAPVVQERVVNGPQIDYSQYGPYTQEVEDEQLVSNQLQGLLASDSPYMRQAALAGQRMAAQRGALSSSIAAGASQASAIQAAFPIAAADAQNYQRVASENAAAINNNNVAKLQSATNMAVSKLQSLTALATTSMDVESRGKIAALNANAQASIAQMQIQAEKENLVFQAAHQRSMEFLAQQGRMDLAEASHQFALEEIGYEGTIQNYFVDKGFQQQLILDDNRAITDLLIAVAGSGADPSQFTPMFTSALAARDGAMRWDFDFSSVSGAGGGGG